jgi:CheY-like chemotaxis protein
MQVHTLTQPTGTRTVCALLPPEDCLFCLVLRNICLSCVSLPRIPHEVDAARLICGSRTEAIMRRNRILIVDNDEDVLISLERVLEENDYDTVTAWDVPEGLELVASSGQFDMLLIGDHPPELNCERLLKLLRQHDVRLPVVVMHSTARHPFSEAYLRHLGASGTACKWSEREVLEAVRNCLPMTMVAPAPRVMRAAAGA